MNELLEQPELCWNWGVQAQVGQVGICQSLTDSLAKCFKNPSVTVSDNTSLDLNAVSAGFMLVVY